MHLTRILFLIFFIKPIISMEKISHSQEPIFNNENFIYFCPLTSCREVCETEALVFEHILKKHETIAKQCHCGKICKNEKLLKYHKRKNHVVDSTTLNPSLEKNKLLFLSEIVTNLNDSECPICAFHAKNYKGLKNHIRLKHEL